MKKPLFIVLFFISLAICACTNPLMDSILQTKTITFESNGGSHVPSQTLLKNEKISEPRAPTKAGFFFGGWFTDDIYFYNSWNFDDIPEWDMTLYAAWHEGAIPAEKNFYIDGLGYFEYDGYPKTVTVTPLGGITVGKITVYYEGTDTNYGKTSNAPINPGTYMVTFDVTAAVGWEAAYGLKAGILTITKAMPNFSHYNISNLTQFVTNTDSISAVTVTPQSGKSPGTITVYYEEINGTTYTKSSTVPSNIGSYLVTFDVAASADVNWSEAYGLEAGTLEINVFKSIDELRSWLSKQNDNYPENAYPVALNVDDLGGASDTSGSAGKMLISNETKYVSLDLSGSTFVYIGANAFNSCDNLTGVTIGNNVSSIEDNAFMGTAITSITIPDNVTSIGASAFEECEGLISVIIGKKVSFIGDKAFYGCDTLTRVTFKGTIPPNGWPVNDTNGFYVFPGDLRDKYFAETGGGQGTYIINQGNATWTKQL